MIESILPRKSPNSEIFGTSSIKVSQFFGTLGKTANSFWLQLWFVPAPGCADLPKNTVCLTYLKKRSIAQFSQKVTQLMESGEPALGIYLQRFICQAQWRQRRLL